jgi:hypothetical protein
MGPLRKNHRRARSLTFEESPLGAALIILLGNAKTWKGPLGVLLATLAAIAGEDATQPKGWPASARLDGWPGNARALSLRLRRLEPILRQIGIAITAPARTSKKRIYTLERCAQAPPSPAVVELGR